MNAKVVRRDKSDRAALVFRSRERSHSSGQFKTTSWESKSRLPVGHEIAKLLLEHRGTFLERAEAVKSALALGMPLHEIEEYLDWTEAIGD